MRMFVLGMIAAIVLAVATGFGLGQLDVSSEVFNSTDNVRLSGWEAE